MGSSPQERIGPLIQLYSQLETKAKKPRSSQHMLETRQDMMVNEIEWMHLKTQDGRNKFYHLVSEIMSGDRVIQLEWDLVLTCGQVCQRLATLGIIPNVEGTRASRALD